MIALNEEFSDADVRFDPSRDLAVTVSRLHPYDTVAYDLTHRKAALQCA